MLDKLTYAGNRANLDGRRARVPPGRHRRPGRGRARRRAGCDAIVNFAAETHVDRSILGAGRVHPHRRARHAGAARPRARDAGSGSSRSRPTRSTATSPLGAPPCTRGRAAAAVEPVLGVEGRRRPAGARLRAHVRRRRAAITRGANTYGPRQYPEKFLPLFVTNALDGEPLPVYGDGRQRREWLHVEDHCAGDRARAARGRRRARSTTSAARSARTSRSSRAILDLTGADAATSSATSTDRPATTAATRVDSSKLRGARLDAGALVRRRRPRGDGRLVPREPRLVGADQVRRVPRLLRAAVRRPPRPAELRRRPRAGLHKALRVRHRDRELRMARRVLAAWPPSRLAARGVCTGLRFGGAEAAVPIGAGDGALRSRGRAGARCSGDRR